MLKYFRSGLLFSVILLYNAMKTEAARIVTTVYPTEDIVIADFDVTDYGADITGIKDATTSIQAAINACYNNGGGTVWMPAGTYKVTGTLFIKSFVTLRGDWRDPDVRAESYGTVLSAQVIQGDSGPVLFQIGGSAGAMGLTVYYPDQNAGNPVPYNYTFNLGASPGQPGTYMASNVINCTMLNSYRGIGIGAIDHNMVHECSTIRNIKGTVLYNAVVAYNGADVSTWSHLSFNNSYWANAGEAYHAPALPVLNYWTRANGVALTLGDLEWDQFYDIRCSDYHIGIHFVKGTRISFCGQFLFANITNTDIAVKADVLDSRWGASFLRSVLSGGTASVQNNSTGYVRLTDCNLTGPTQGTVQISSAGTSPDFYEESTSVPKITRAVFFDVSKAPYYAPFSAPQNGLPQTDATSAIQTALNDAGNQGGGLVYLPAGRYMIGSFLTVPANVELRGCSSVPQLDQSDLSYGTTLMGYYSHNTATPESDTALVTLNGNMSGISGIRFFYPNNNPARGVKPYPFTIRGNGSGLYLVNIGLTGVYNAIDFCTYRCDNHFIRNVSGAIYHKGITVGASAQGWIEDCLTNPAKADRCSYGVQGWLDESKVFTHLINPVTKVHEKHIIVDGASNEQILNCFSYGANLGLWVQSGTVNCFNFGTDNVGEYSVRVDCGAGNNVKIMNLMRYNGTTSTGATTIYNEMHLSENLNPPAAPPLILSNPRILANAGLPYKYAITAIGTPAPALRVIGNPYWLKLNGFILSGTPPDTGSFGPITVTAASSACPNALQTFNIVSMTAVADTLNPIIVYPNPSDGIFTIEFVGESQYKIEILDALGQTVFSKSFQKYQKTNEINFTKQARGIYFIKVTSSRGIVAEKIFIY